MSAKSFNVGGGWGSTYSWNASIDDEAALDSDGKKTANGILQYQWDVSGQYAQGAGSDNHLIVFVPGTTVNNGIWFYRTSDVDSAAIAAVPTNYTRYSNQSVNWNIAGILTGFSSSDAFVNGVIPTSAPPGPTVTSITATTIFVPSDTVSNTDFTLLKNGSAYANTNISLTGPGAQPPSDARGYTYSLTYNGTGYYQRGIDSKSISEFFYDASWTSSPSSGRTTNSNRILNVLASIPVNTHIQSEFGTDLTTYHQTRYMRHTVPLYQNNVHTENVHIDFEVTNETINNTDEIVGKFHMEHASAAVNASTNTPTVYSISSSNSYIIGNQEFMTTSFNYNGDIIGYRVVDWVYEDEPEGDGYVAPVTTSSDGGGKRRYPIISTNLFDRQKSIFSIGLTHKDETLF